MCHFLTVKQRSIYHHHWNLSQMLTLNFKENVVCVWVNVQRDSTLLVNELTSVIFQLMHNIISRPVHLGSLWYNHSLIWTVLELTLTNWCQIFCQNHTLHLCFYTLCGFLFQKGSFLWNWQKWLLEIHKKKIKIKYGENVFDITGSIKVLTMNIIWTTKMCFFILKIY